MDIYLKVSPQVLQSAAGSIQEQIRDISQQFEQIRAEITQTRSFWEGAAGDSHQSQYDRLQEDIREAVSRLKQHPVNLLQMAGLYSETESNMQAEAQSLQEDVIV